MGDMKEDFLALHEYNKEKREKRFTKWLELINKAGAKELSSGVYRLGDWDLYPYKSGARNYKTKKRAYIGDVLSVV